jgi:hypothetical protein
MTQKSAIHKFFLMVSGEVGNRESAVDNRQSAVGNRETANVKRETPQFVPLTAVLCFVNFSVEPSLFQFLTSSLYQLYQLYQLVNWSTGQPYQFPISYLLSLPFIYSINFINLINFIN